MRFRAVVFSLLVGLVACNQAATGSSDPGQSTPSSAVATPAANPEPLEEMSMTPRNAEQIDGDLRDSYYRCAASSDGSTWGMQDCIEKEFEYQDARLNAVYRELLSKLPEEKKNRLRDDERQWLVDRDQACKWDAETEGQAQRIEANACSLKKTAERAKQLEEMLHDPGSP